MKLRKHSIRKSIFIVLVACFLFPFFAQAIWANQHIYSIIEKKVYALTEKNIENAALNIAATLQSQYDIVSFYRGDKLITSAVESLGTLTAGEKQVLSESLKSKLIKNSGVSIYGYLFDYMLMDYEGGMITPYAYTPYAGYTEIYRTIAGEEWFSALKDSYTSRILMFRTPNYFNPKNSDRFCVAGNVMDSEGRNRGVFLIAVDAASLSEMMKSLLPSDMGCIISGKGEAVISTPDAGLSSGQIGQALDGLAQEGVKTLVLDGKKYLASERVLRVQNYSDTWRLFTLIPFSEVMGELDSVRFFSYGILLLYLLSIVLVEMLLDRSVIQPILRLRDSVQQVTSGDLSVRVAGLPDNEFRQLGSGFNQMVENLQAHVADIRKQEQWKRQTEVKLLQSQIKPHFVRNTLNTIRWLAELQGASGVSNAIMAYSGMLDYNFKDAELYSTVGEEIGYLKKYLFLQELRFQSKFRVKYEVDESALSCRVLKLSMQPIVENCIYHGLLPMEGVGVILIHAKRQEDAVFIIIEDNGIGMEPGVLSRLLFPPEEEIDKAVAKTESIALWNIDQRMKLYFDPECGIQVESEPGRGTRVTLRFPLKGEGEPDENSDCR